MAERTEFLNPNLCINPGVIETTGGRGYCNPIYGKKYRDATGECGKCPKPARENLRSNGRDFISETEKREEEIARDIRVEKIRRNAKHTGIYFRI